MSCECKANRLGYSVPNNVGQIFNLRGIGGGLGDGTGVMRWGGKIELDTVQTSNPIATQFADPKINFNLGNSIYGASDTVQPVSLYGLSLIRAYQA